MECPACHNDNPPGQKYCGICGQNLEKECGSCGETNPLAFNFCGRCGHSLAAAGTITLTRSALIADVDQEAAALLGYPREEMTGKPFSLFVFREDLPIYFVHWNELRGSYKRQTSELALRHKTGKKIYVMIQWTYEEHTDPQNQLFQLNLNPAGSQRSALDQLQHQQDLLNLISSLADSVRTASSRHLDAAIVQGLKEICLFSKADRCFIYTINRRRKKLEISHQWSQPSGPGTKTPTQTVPLAAIKRSIARLRRERAYFIDDVSKLPVGERAGLLAAFNSLPGSLMCQLIYTHKRPIAIVGIAKNQAESEWPPECAALIKLFGHLVCDLLPSAIEGKGTLPAKSVSIEEGIRRPKSSRSKEDRNDHGHPAQPVRAGKSGRQGAKTLNAKSSPIEAKPLPDLGRPMQLEKLAGKQSIERQRVYAREDGLVLLTCPHCGLRESVTLARFERLGNAITVLCNCHKRFAAVLEKRRSARKAVHLEGHFTIAEYGPNDTKGSIWGPMVVKNLSKSGMRFSSQRADLIRPGDVLMVRFNLDNSNKALIHKKVEVVSIQGKYVGCRFTEADEYDITLGFYFI
jgi:PAS domain S-box-containing protein